jgi:hypothetical protein
MIESCEAGLNEGMLGIRTGPYLRDGLFPLGDYELDLNRAVRAATALTAELDEDERERLSFEVVSDAWRKWCNIHRFLMRHGLLLDDLSESNRGRVIDLVATALSEEGLHSCRGVMQINETIQEITGRLDEQGFPEFGEWMYWLSLFGEPSATEPWGWQLDGHHLNINCLMVAGQAVVTPFFLGSEPLEAPIGRYKGVRVLEREETLALAFIDSLDDEQRAKCVVSEQMPPGLFTGAFSDNVVLPYEGIAFRALGDHQQRQLLDLIGVYVGRLSDDLAERKMIEVTAHLGETHLCWMGGTTSDDVFYYRIHSPVILLEFDHEPGIVYEGLAPMKSHVHTMMRTPNGNDYGKDYLRQHRAIMHDHDHGHTH